MVKRHGQSAPIAAALAVLVSFAAPSLSLAIDLERVLMPGDVIEGHAKYENECTKCHKPFSKEAQNRRCLDCHEFVDADLKKKEGFHGKSREVGDRECRYCHPEHKGREADVVRLDKEVFDHSETDYALKGGHVRVRCDKCHPLRQKPDGKKEKYRDAPARCIACHKESDVHKTRLGEKCADCHDEKGWKKSSFDHEKTKFSLKGKHADAACASCHPNERYKKTPKLCYDCHRFDDTHNGKYGKKCADCHTEKEWKKARFDHDKTKFKLREKHEKAACNACHADAKYYNGKVPTECFGCHEHDDEHKGRYGKKCKDCHVEKSWKETDRFDHDKTKYKLEGKHKKVVCSACHRGRVYDGEKLPSDCHGCHKEGDVHKGQQGKKCEKCHDVNGWSKKVSFDHDLTKFPLVGLHAVTPCEQCHLTTAYKDAKKECLSCHKKDDKHEKKLGPRCEDCHTPNGWKLWRFDHDKQTKFKLDGGHKGLDCLRCHKEPVKAAIKIPGCVNCHSADDEHSGRFGLACDRCHVTSSFREIKPR